MIDSTRVLFCGEILMSALHDNLHRTGIFVVADRLLRKFIENGDYLISLLLPENCSIEDRVLLQQQYGLNEDQIWYTKVGKNWRDRLFDTFLKFRKAEKEWVAIPLLIVVKLMNLVSARSTLSVTATSFRESKIIVINPCYLPLGKIYRRRSQEAVSLHIVYDLIPILHPEYFNNRNPKDHILYGFLKGTDRRKDIYASISQSTKLDLESFLGRVRGGVFYLGYEQPASTKLSAQSKSVVEPQEKKVLLCVSTIEPRKNLLFSLRLFALMEQKYPSMYRLVVVGAKGWDTGTTLEQLLSLPGVTVAGYVTDDQLQEYYRQAHAFIYPSFYEGFGLPIVEAMSHGVPVLVSRNSSLPEVAGDVGFYVDPAEPETGVIHLQNLASKAYWESVSERSRERARQFTWESSYRDLVALLGIAKRPEEA